jgi:pimeloyl-ACP methyl ester carboxylesterase
VEIRGPLRRNRGLKLAPMRRVAGNGVELAVLDRKLFRDLLAAQDTERYVADLSRPGALTAGLNWYRANSAPELELADRVPFPAVAAPTLGLWSGGDSYLTEGPMLRTADHVTGTWCYERNEGAGHWLQLDAPEQVNRLLLEYLG